MNKIVLYRYNRPDGGVNVSPIKPDVDFTELFRLVSDEGMVLTNGTIQIRCVDTDDPDGWTEIEDTKGIINPNKATDEDYQNALRDMGVKL